MRERERRSGFNSLLVLVAVCVLFFAVFARQLASEHAFAPQPGNYEEGGPVRLVQTPDGIRLAVYWAPVAGAKWTVFYLHGNDQTLDSIADVLTGYRLQGVNALAFDYRGYGLSEGQATERNAYDDAEFVYRYALQELRVEEGALIAHGRALGAAVAAELAKRRNPAGLVLESPFLSLYRLVLPMAWIPGDKFDLQAKAEHIDCPVLIMHGTADAVAPIAHGRKLAGLIGPREVKALWVEGGQHADLRTRFSDAYWGAVRSFLSELRRGQRAADAPSGDA